VDAEPGEHADPEDDLRGRMAFVEVRPPAQDPERRPRQPAADEPARVADRSRDGPARDLGVGQHDGLVQVVREPAEAAAEDDGDAGPQLGGRADDGRRLGEALGHAVPSASRRS
jgi:hypothetical protein